MVFQGSFGEHKQVFMNVVNIFDLYNIRAI